MAGMIDICDTVKAALKKAVPTLCDELVDNVVRKLTEEVGVSAVEDLTAVQEQDFIPYLKPIQARKILAAWSQSGKFPYVVI